MSAPIQAKSMGTALNRVDGPLKVTGTAKYPADSIYRTSCTRF